MNSMPASLTTFLLFFVLNQLKGHEGDEKITVWWLPSKTLQVFILMIWQKKTKRVNLHLTKTNTESSYRLCFIPRRPDINNLYISTHLEIIATKLVWKRLESYLKGFTVCYDAHSKHYCVPLRCQKPGADGRNAPNAISLSGIGLTCLVTNSEIQANVRDLSRRTW